jgi:outer membrane protein assembly factor BamB
MHPNGLPVLRLRRSGLLVLALFAGLLVSCSGGAANKSWPGLAVKDSVAYLAHNSFISAVNIDTGAKIWSYPAKADAAVLFYSDPLIDSQGDLVAGAYNGNVVKLDAATGVLKWSYTGDGQQIVAPIAEGPDGAYYISSESGDLIVLDPAAGTLKTRIKLGKEGSWGAMAADDKRLYIGTVVHKVLAVDFATQKIAWETDLGASIAGGVNLVDGKLVAGTFNKEIFALDPATGAKLWTAATDGWVWEAPVVSGGAIFATDLGGVLRAINLADGSPLWNAKLEAPIQGGAAVLDGTVFVGTSKGNLRAYDAATGAQKWTQTIEGGIYGNPRIAAGKLLVVVNGGKVQLAALSTDSGAVVWTYVDPT